MKKFNLFNEIIVAERAALMQAFNSSKDFGITHEGRVVYAPFSPYDVFIYQGCVAPAQPSALAPHKALGISELLGKPYRVVEDDERVLIKAAGAWQEIIGMNTGHADYDDTTGDGIAEFSDRALEDIGWHATEFNIGYRELVEVIEEHCEGTLLCIEQKEPYQFSGLGFIADREKAHTKLFEYCKAKIADTLENNEDFAPGTLNDDETEAAEFFGLL